MTVRELTDGERELLAEIQAEEEMPAFQITTSPVSKKPRTLACGCAIDKGERYTRHVWKDSEGLHTSTVCGYCYYGYERP